MIAADRQAGNPPQIISEPSVQPSPAPAGVHGARLRRRFSPQDAAFFYFEREESPANVGVVGIFEGELPYEKLLAHIESRLDVVPRYMQRAVPPPLNAGRPTWEYDPRFEIRRHIMRLRLDPPGTDEQLLELAGRLYAGRLDRGKPLWEVYLVEGLEHGRTAIVCKVHHSLVDGVGGIELLMVTLDVSPHPPPAARPAPYRPPPRPGPLRLFLDAVFDGLAEGVDRWAGLQSGLADLMLGGDVSTVRLLRRTLEVALPYFVVPMTPAPFNASFSGKRTLAVMEIPFAEARAVRRASGGTVNDLVLAVLAGALGRYLELHGETTQDRVMRIVTPVNVRKQDERGTLGNRISLLALEVPVGVSDPIECLRAVSERMGRLKQDHLAEGVEMAANFLFGLPAPLVAAAGSAPLSPNRTAHMVCTNVPGPMIPLYAVGHRLLAAYPLLPIMWQMGIGCAVMSYDQKLFFTLLADPAAAPDLGALKRFLYESWARLRMAAGVEELPFADSGEGERRWAIA